ncbi:MAG: PepSY domain-containing protein [Novosphingobium sp.]
MRFSTLGAVAAAAASLALASPALADGKIACRGGPRSGWTNIERLRQKLAREGWRIRKAEVSRDCYEVYGRTPEGDNVESFFHPVSLDRILILKRGRELYRAPGY